MLWVGAALAIATVSVCDFHRASAQFGDDLVISSAQVGDASAQFDDDFVFSSAVVDDDFPVSPAGFGEVFSVSAGLFCYRLEFFGEVEQQRYSQADEDDEMSDISAALKAAQAFGVLVTIFIPLALILYHVVFFVKLPNRAVAKGMWWTIRILAIAAVVCTSLTFVAYEGVPAECRKEELECGLGPGAVLAGINVIMLIILTVCLFLSGPPQAPFRCGSCNCCEDNGSVRRGDEGKTAQTTTTEEATEDGRRSITTETVDAYGNKKIVKKMAAAAL
jgi:hypothetical protein